jgi:PAS domain-containing protein
VTAPPGPSHGSAATPPVGAGATTHAEHRAEPHAEPDAGAVAEGVLRALPEPALLVTAAGTIVAANAPAAALFGTPSAALRGAALTDHLADAPAHVGRYLDACARTRAPIPGALRVRSAARPERRARAWWAPWCDRARRPRRRSSSCASGPTRGRAPASRC